MAAPRTPTGTITRPTRPRNPPGYRRRPPLHTHKHRTTARTALLLIFGSSPMVEGIPAFFAASTMTTHVAVCVYSTAGLQPVSLGPFEHYGEVISGMFISLVGVVFWLWPVI